MRTILSINLLQTCDKELCQREEGCCDEYRCGLSVDPRQAVIKQMLDNNSYRVSSLLEKPVLSYSIPIPSFALHYFVYSLDHDKMSSH